MLVLPVVLEVVVGRPPNEEAGCEGGGGGESEFVQKPSRDATFNGSGLFQNRFLAC